MRVYSDISSGKVVQWLDLCSWLSCVLEWVTGDPSLPVKASSIVDTEFVALQMDLLNPQAFSEINDRPQDATGFYVSKFVWLIIIVKNSCSVLTALSPSNSVVD